MTDPLARLCHKCSNVYPRVVHDPLRTTIATHEFDLLARLRSLSAELREISQRGHPWLVHQADALDVEIARLQERLNAKQRA